MIKAKIQILIIVLLCCSSCMLWKEKPALPKKGYLIHIVHQEHPTPGIIYSFNKENVTITEIDKQFERAILKYHPVVIIEAGPNIKYRDLLRLLEIIHPYDIQDIYIVGEAYPRPTLQNRGVTYHLDFPNIEIKFSNHVMPKPNRKDDEKFADKFSTYFNNQSYDSSEISPVVRCPPDMQQYWLNRVIMNLCYYSPNVFCILETEKQKYKIKLIAPSYELHQLFKEFEEDVSEPPPPSPTPEEE